MSGFKLNPKHVFFCHLKFIIETNINGLNQIKASVYETKVEIIGRVSLVQIEINKCLLKYPAVQSHEFTPRYSF